jgi:hypothetical protein
MKIAQEQALSGERHKRAGDLLALRKLLFTVQMQRL